MRQAVKERKTLETAVSVSIGLDGSGKADIATGVGFFDHMLTPPSPISGILGQRTGRR